MDAGPTTDIGCYPTSLIC